MFAVRTTAWGPGDRIPEKYVAYGSNVSPPVMWDDVPEDARELVLVMVDRSARDWLHWVVDRIPPGTDGLVEGASASAALPAGARQLRITSGRTGYGGPKPPPGSGDHRYELVLYALDTPSALPETDLTMAGIDALLGSAVIATAVHAGIDSR